LVGKWLMYEESIRIPLIVRPPRSWAAKRGARVTAAALNIDVAPTVLECLGVPQPVRTQGKSLWPLCRNGPAPWREDWYYEFASAPGSPLAASEGVRSAAWKYIWYPHEKYESLFHLAEDPGEHRDLARDPKYRVQVEAMRARLKVLRQEAG
jgi:arylsulfatase A-like enzyme